jgi:hypothetical protein
LLHARFFLCLLFLKLCALPLSFLPGPPVGQGGKKKKKTGECFAFFSKSLKKEKRHSEGIKKVRQKIKRRQKKRADAQFYWTSLL